jgi:hypothetical protein
MCHIESAALEMEDVGVLPTARVATAIELLRESFELDSDQPLKKIKKVMEFSSNIGQIPSEHRRAMLSGISDLLQECVLLLDDVIQTSAEFDLVAHASSADGLPRLAAAAALENGETAHGALCLLEKGRGLATPSLLGATFARDLQLRSEVPADLRAKHAHAWKELRSAVYNGVPFSRRRECLSRLRAAEAAIHSAIGSDRLTDDLGSRAILELASSCPIVVNCCSRVSRSSGDSLKMVTTTSRKRMNFSSTCFAKYGSLRSNQSWIAYNFGHKLARSQSGRKSSGSRLDC